ncbi:MAG: hypothetical protein ACYDC6_00950 [Acidobacteriaceae bacterium]
MQPCRQTDALRRAGAGRAEGIATAGGTDLGGALDGTECFCSLKLSCPQCLARNRSNGKSEHYHAMLAAMIVAPGHNMVLPLMPEFIAPQDGAEKQDCELSRRRAAKRWLIAHGERVAGSRLYRNCVLPTLGAKGAKKPPSCVRYIPCQPPSTRLSATTIFFRLQSIYSAN